MSSVKFGFLGAGNMGSALARAVVKSAGENDVIISDQSSVKAQLLADELKCSYADNNAVVSSAKYIFLGVKPQVMPQVIESILPVLKKRNDRFVLVTMAAGVKISALEEMLGYEYPIIRIMPNTPVSVGKGMILYTCSDNVFMDEVGEFCDALKFAQQQIANLLYYSIGLIPHNAAYAYIPGRCHLDALKQHQENESKWFLKLDIKDFFPSCTKRLVWQQLHKLYPIALWGDVSKEYLSKLLQLCCLNGVLPQGSPASPLLSNLIFVQIDKIIQDFLIEANPKTQRLVYTRYADDMCISAKNSFDFKFIEFHIQRILDPEFKLKKEKTRYGSSAGRNWNLGLMLNKDNKITTGAVNKRKLKAMICNFILAEKEDRPFTVPELQQFLGIINYAKQIEPDYINFLLKKYSTKYDLDVLKQIKYRLKAALR